MGITYDEIASGAEEVTITRERALSELRKHGVTSRDEIADFYTACGYRSEYRASVVLRWLGY